MAYRVIWTVEAVDDLQAIAEYIERDAPHYASAVVDKILAITRTLPDHPQMGRVVPEFEQVDVRERFVFSYRVVYQVKGDEIRVLNVIHGSRLYTRESP
ncbi:MAG TPA: type II toxin-antitoxin system RelE/ParE family toxin [Gammaproteobacteria bacterium]